MFWKIKSLDTSVPGLWSQHNTYIELNAGKMYNWSLKYTLPKYIESMPFRKQKCLALSVILIQSHCSPKFQIQEVQPKRTWFVWIYTTQNDAMTMILYEYLEGSKEKICRCKHIFEWYSIAAYKQRFPVTNEEKSNRKMLMPDRPFGGYLRTFFIVIFTDCFLTRKLIETKFDIHIFEIGLYHYTNLTLGQNNSSCIEKNTKSYSTKHSNYL